MFFELRQYTIKKGMCAKWVELMDEIIIPFQKKMGMEIVGSFTVPDNDNLYIWIRRFDSEEQRKATYDKVYGSDYWKRDIREAMGDMLIKSETKVTRLIPTPGSALK